MALGLLTHRRGRGRTLETSDLGPWASEVLIFRHILGLDDHTDVYSRVTPLYLPWITPKSLFSDRRVARTMLSVRNPGGPRTEYVQVRGIAGYKIDP